MVVWYPRKTWQDALRLQREGIEPQAFRAVRAPAIMLHGDSDPHPGRATYEVLRRWMPRVDYVELPKCGHTPWLERAARAEFLHRLDAWLRSA